MTQEEFDRKYIEPVDLVEAHAALSRFTNGRGTLRVPVTPQDDDMLISRALNELKGMRVRCAKDEVYVVQGRSGIVFSATTNYEEAVKVKDSLNEIESDRAKMGYWENNKNILQD